jgi:hypothetical protein
MHEKLSLHCMKVMTDNDKDFRAYTLFLVSACLYLDMDSMIDIDNGIQFNLYRHGVLVFKTGTQQFTTNVQGSNMQSTGT